MIRLEDVCFDYPGSGEALRSVSLKVAPGELLALVGANGSGKSTLLAVAAGLFEPSSGRVTASGRVRLMIQQSELEILGATVGEDLMLGREKQGAEAEARARAMANGFGLGDLWDASVSSLSFGQRRKLCLAAALLDEPDALLLDEPFSGLDYPAEREMRRLLAANKKKGLAQAVATHDLEPLMDLADVAALLDGGRLIACGLVEDVLERVEAHGVRAPCAWRLRRGLPPWEEDGPAD
ncbi:MAG: energy-coupling factor ABC transporter ATP-binding protein [Desulfovibrionaceae bacterium]